MRLVQLRIRGTVSSRSDASEMLTQPGDAVLVERGRPRLLVLMCPDGCGEELVVNVDRQAGKAWRLYRPRDSLTLFPSIWRDTGCQSHFIVSRGRIFLFGVDRERDEQDDAWRDVFGPTQEEVLEALSPSELETADVIAD